MMNKSLTSTKMMGGSTKKWSRIKYPESYIRYLIWLGTLLFLTFSIEYLDIPLERLMGMLERMGYTLSNSCLLYTSDAADEGLGVDLGGRRII